MDEKKENCRLIPEKESRMIVPPKPLDNEDVSKVSGGSKEQATDTGTIAPPEVHDTDEKSKKPSFWDRFRKKDKEAKNVSTGK